MTTGKSVDVTRQTFVSKVMSLLYNMLYLLYSLQPKMDKLCTVNKNKTGNWLWLRSWTPYCQIQTELKKVGNTTRPFRYDLNQILYEYTVEVRNRFKGLDLIDRGPDELWTEVHDIVRRQWSRSSTRKINLKSKMAFWGSLTNSCEKKRSESKGEKERYKHLNAEFPRIARRDKKAFFSDQCRK